MNIQKVFSIATIMLNWFYIIKCNSVSFQLKKVIKVINFYQVTSFLSDNFTNNSNSNVYSTSEFPSVTYSFNQVTHFNSKNVYALQESLVIFRTNDTYEIEIFIDFLMPQLSVGKRPKCLIVCSSSNIKFLIKSLKYAWKNKFIDFSIIVEDHENNTASLFYYNPYSDTVYREELQDANIEIFPNKLKNINGYPFYTPQNTRPSQFAQFKRPKRKLETVVQDYAFINFIARILNLNVVAKNVTFQIPVAPDFLKKWNLDIYPVQMYGRNYSTYNLVSIDNLPVDTVAFVPIIATSRVGIFLKFLFNVIVISAFISIFLVMYNYFQNSVGYIRVFDIVLLLFGQSIRFEPTKMTPMVIVIMVILTSFILMNDIFFDITSILYEKGEVAFESFEDLYFSGLQTFTSTGYFNHPLFLNLIRDDPYLLKVLNRTQVMDIYECLHMLKDWKNVSCIEAYNNPNDVVSFYLGPDQSQAMKIAEPPVEPGMMFFYWFADASPYATKFLETMRRIKETSLMHWPALVYRENRKTVEIPEINPSLGDEIKLEHLLVILSIGYLISVFAFVVEFVMFRNVIVKSLKNRTNGY